MNVDSAVVGLLREDRSASAGELLYRTTAWLALGALWAADPVDLLERSRDEWDDEGGEGVPRGTVNVIDQDISEEWRNASKLTAAEMEEICRVNPDVAGTVLSVQPKRRRSKRSFIRCRRRGIPMESTLISDSRCRAIDIALAIQRATGRDPVARRILFSVALGTKSAEATCKELSATIGLPVERVAQIFLQMQESLVRSIRRGRIGPSGNGEEFGDPDEKEKE